MNEASDAYVTLRKAAKADDDGLQLVGTGCVISAVAGARFTQRRQARSRPTNMTKHPIALGKIPHKYSRAVIFFSSRCPNFYFQKYAWYGWYIYQFSSQFLEKRGRDVPLAEMSRTPFRFAYLLPRTAVEL